MAEESETGPVPAAGSALSTAQVPVGAGVPGPASGASPGMDGEAGWTQVDPRMKTLWRIGASVPLGFLFLACAILACIGHFRGFPLLRTWGVIGGLGLLPLAYAGPGWAARRRHEATAYRIEGPVLEHRSGIFWRVTVAIPVSRLQHVDLHRGPVERALGLATLRLFTAGSRNAEHEIPGIEHERARALRDRLLGAGGRGVDRR